MRKTQEVKLSAASMVNDWWSRSTFDKLDGRSGPNGYARESDDGSRGMMQLVSIENHKIVSKELQTGNWPGMSDAIKALLGGVPDAKSKRPHPRWPQFAAAIIEVATEVYPTIRTEFED